MKEGSDKEVGEKKGSEEIGKKRSSRFLFNAHFPLPTTTLGEHHWEALER